MENEVLHSDNLRLRLIDLEYKGLKSEDFKREIRRIYFEETGHEFEADIEILKSSEAKSLKGDQSGYDGTAIYFKTKDFNLLARKFGKWSNPSMIKLMI